MDKLEKNGYNPVFDSLKDRKTLYSLYFQAVQRFFPSLRSWVIYFLPLLFF